MNEPVVKAMIYADLSRALLAIRFKGYNTQQVNSDTLIPVSNVYSADQFHSKYRPWEVIVFEPKDGHYYKFIFLLHSLAARFFFIQLDCANPNCKKQWIGFWR